MTHSAEKGACDGCQKRPCVCETVVLPTVEKDASALDRRCSQCGQPFREHKAHLDPTERGGFRASMTCPIPPAKTEEKP